MDKETQQCILDLHKIGAIKFGNYKLKSGAYSPVYIDLRMIISYPDLLRKISSLMWRKVKGFEIDYICGVPYTALPIATCCSLRNHIPMVMRRKERKDYGTSKLIEGVFDKGKKCLVMEDLITSGMSVFETIKPLEESGLDVEHIVAFIDREQGGRKTIEEKGYKFHSVVSLSEVLKATGNEELLRASENSA